MVCVVHVAPVGVHLTFPRTHETFARTPPRTPSAPPHNARIPSSCRRPFLVLHLTLRQQNACRQQCDVPGYRVKLMLWWITWRARHCCGLGGRPTRRYFVHFSLLDNPLVQVSFERSYVRGSGSGLGRRGQRVAASLSVWCQQGRHHIAFGLRIATPIHAFVRPRGGVVTNVKWAESLPTEVSFRKIVDLCDLRAREQSSLSPCGIATTQKTMPCTQAPRTGPEITARYLEVRLRFITHACVHAELHSRGTSRRRSTKRSLLL